MSEELLKRSQQHRAALIVVPGHHHAPRLLRRLMETSLSQDKKATENCIILHHTAVHTHTHTHTQLDVITQSLCSIRAIKAVSKRAEERLDVWGGGREHGRTSLKQRHMLEANKTTPQWNKLGKSHSG